MTDQITSNPATTQPQVREVTVPEALRLAGQGYRIIDVREELEWNDGHIPSATLVSLGDVLDRLEEVVPDKATPLLVHCAVGARSARAVARMESLGYTNVFSMRGSLLDLR